MPVAALVVVAGDRSCSRTARYGARRSGVEVETCAFDGCASGGVENGRKTALLLWTECSWAVKVEGGASDGADDGRKTVFFLACSPLHSGLETRPTDWEGGKGDEAR